MPALHALLFGNRFSRHTIFWAVFVLVNAFAWGFAEGNNFINQLRNELWLLPIKLVVVYFNLWYLVPQLLLQRKRAIYFLCLFACYLAGTLMMRWTYLHIIAETGQDAPFFNTYRLWKYFLFDINFAVIITTGIKLLYYFYSQQQTAYTLRQEKQAAEIRLLKSQVNPHFLFNTMNNLYSLTLHNSAKASEVVLKLSDIMRYMVYEGSREYVPIKDEMNYLRDYIAIETIRYGDELQLSLKTECETGDLVIAPLLLIPFVENIFKHGIEKDPARVSASICIRIVDDQLICVFYNDRPPGIPVKASNEGLGISNVKKRLQLIYPGRHELKIDEGARCFKVELKITLNKISSSKW